MLRGWATNGDSGERMPEGMNGKKRIEGPLTTSYKVREKSNFQSGKREMTRKSSKLAFRSVPVNDRRTAIDQG